MGNLAIWESWRSGLRHKGWGYNLVTYNLQGIAYELHVESN